eukprot:1985859-Ditylum_brightwellii.AAC.1
MAINAQPIDKITKAFMHPVLPRIVGKPTYKNLYEVHKLLMKNASTISSTIRGGNHGHIGLVLEAPKCLQLTGVAFAVPLNHGPIPWACRPFMTPAEIENECQNHHAALVTFQAYNNMGKALHNQFIVTFEDRYIKALHQGIIEYSNQMTYTF